MKKKIKRFSPQSLSDSQSINLVCHLLTYTRRIKTDIKSDDTTPNIDGYITVLTDNGIQDGDFQVQVKTLQQKGCYKFRDSSFFNYCKSQLQTPILLLCADLENRIVYWEEMNKTAINEALEDNLKVKFDKENIISIDKKDFVEKWSTILQKQRSNTIDAIRINEILGETEIIGISDEKNIYLHKFLDEYNSLLDGKFLRLKRLYYPMTWKVGIAYFKLEKDGCDYTFFPINIDKNDIAIKRIPSSKKKNILHKYHLLISHVGNPFEKDPINYARQEITRLFRDALEGYEFNTLGSEYLAREYIFAFIKRYHMLMGLELKSSYSLKDLKRAYFNYFPNWCDKAIEYLSKEKRVDLEPIHQPFIDLKDLIDELTEDEQIFISKETDKEDLKSENIMIPPYFNSKEFPLKKFPEYIEYLESKNFIEVKSLFKEINEEEEDYKKDLDSNLGIFLSVRDPIYQNFLTNNFPFLAGLKKPSRNYIYWDFKSQTTTDDNIKHLFMEEIQVYQGRNHTSTIIETDKDWEDLKEKYLKEKGGLTPPVSYRQTAIEFLLNEDLPLHSYIYRELEADMNKYFKEILRTYP